MTTKQSNLQETTTSPLAQPKHPYHQVLKWVADGEEIQGLTKNDGWWDLEHNDVFAHCTEFGDKFYFQPNEFRIKPRPHIHQELMDAYKEGASIQFFSKVSREWFSEPNPSWYEDYKYRIKPQPKPDIKRYIHVTNERSVDVCKYFPSCWLGAILEVTLDGETKAIKSSEVYKGQAND